MNIRQIVFDIEGEYINIAKSTDTFVYNDTNFNILYIPEIYISNNKNNFLDLKIEELYADINHILGSKLDKYEKEIKTHIKDIYLKFGITGDMNNMYSYSGINKEYRKYSNFPSQIDLIEKLKADKVLPKTYIKQLEEVDLFKKYNFYEGEKLNSKFDTFIVFDLKKLDTKNFDIYINYIKEYYGDKLLIYIDEMWKIINRYKEEQLDIKIAELFKTIRKNKAGIVVISQDIHDILKYKNGTFGKSILNNSYTKLYFKMQYMDLDLLKELGIYSDTYINSIRKLIKGQAFMQIGDNSFNLDIKTSKFENLLIEGGDDVEEDTSSN